MLRVQAKVKQLESELKPLEEKMIHLERSGAGPERADVATQISKRQMELRKLTKRLVVLKNTRANKHIRAGTRRKTSRRK